MKTASRTICLTAAGMVSLSAAPAFAAGNLVDSPNRADLIYDTSTGNVKLDATDSAGGFIAIFQLENSLGTFVPGNYISPGSGFGGQFEDVTNFVVADAHQPFNDGFSGIADLGNVLPTGLDLTGLEAYLITASYAGEFGSGTPGLDLIVVPEPTSLALLGLGGLLMVRRRRG